MINSSRKVKTNGKYKQNLQTGPTEEMKIEGQGLIAVNVVKYLDKIIKTIEI